MPLSEFHRTTTKEKGENTHSRMNNSSADLFSMPDHEFAELRWENGQIVMQSQSSRPRKGSFPTAGSAEAGRIQEKDGRDAANPKMPQSCAIDSILNDLSPSVPSAHIGLNAEDDDIAPWMHFPIENPLQNDYCSEFLNEFPAFHLNSLSAHNVITPGDRSSGLSQEARNSNNVEHGQASKALTESSMPRKARTDQLFQLSQHSRSIPSSKSRVTNLGNGGSNKTQKGPCENSVSTRLQNHNLASPKQLQPNRGTGVLNFSHFSRPAAALAKATAQNIDRLRRTEKATTPSNSNPVESSLIDPTSGLKSVNEIQGDSAPVALKAQLQSLAKPPREVIPVEQSTAICQDDASGKDNSINTNNSSVLPDHVPLTASMNLPRCETDSDPEAVVAPSSVCSANGAQATSNDCEHREKRKNCEGEESRYQSEDFEDESVGFKKPATGWGKSAKRSRAAEVHNLSERRRRDRINEKMRALQELIPNCNKTDKASMLEEAIEYLRTLQMQVQIMSMGSRLCMPPMMLPTGLQHMHAPAMAAHYPPMGLGMGMGLGLGFGMGMCEMNGSPGCPMIPAPPMHGPPFPCPSTSGPSGLHSFPGSIGPQMFGTPGHGIPVTMPVPPRFASFPGVSVNANPLPEVAGATNGPQPAADTAPSSTSENQQLKITNLETLQKSGTDNSQIPTSSSQVEKEGV